MKVCFTDEALDDLASIRAYIAEQNPNAAERIGQKLVETCDGLSMFPDRGRPGVAVGTREMLSVWPYVIVYCEMDGAVQILRVWHGARNRT